jgi:amidase
VTLNERVLDDARALEGRVANGERVGPLAGVPVGIKDVTEVAGLRTTYGSPLYAGHVPDEDAVVVRRLRAADALVIGKTNTPEFAAGGNTWNEVFGRTRNPWDPARSAGGSTGGGAAALATGMIALAEGTDLGGSLRIPASFCGVVGLRPSPGLVPTYPTGFVWDTLQVTGPMARTANDVELMLRAIAGPTALAPLASRALIGDGGEAKERGGRIAWCRDLAGIGVDPGVERACHGAVEGLAAGGWDVEALTLDLAFARPAFLALRGLWFTTWLYEHLDRVDELGVNVRNNVKAGLAMTVREMAAAERARGRLWHLFRHLLERYDVLVTPTMAVAPFPVDQNYPDTVGGRKMETYIDWLAPTFVLSLTGLPVASVPCGRDADGLPVGLQIVGPPAGEERVLAAARHLHDVYPPVMAPVS